jgi:C1A family cysteine protease
MKDIVDKRDHQFLSRVPKNVILKEVIFDPVNLSNKLGPVRDQGTIGSCTAFAATALVRYVREVSFMQAFPPSALFTYYATRLIGGTVNQDSGAYVRDAIKSTVNSGITEQSRWPYDVSKFKLRPSRPAWRSAKKNQTLEYLRITKGSVAQMKQCLADGFPFIFGILIYESFFDTVVENTGVVSKPNVRTESFEGGHCMICSGWRLIGGEPYFIVQNSWGTAWGDRGYCYIPQSVMADEKLVMDLWTIREVEGIVIPQPSPSPSPSVTPPPPPATPTPTPVPSATPVPTPTP